MPKFNSIKRSGRKPRIFICKLDRTGMTAVVGAAFSDLGFEVTLGPLFQTPEEAAKEAVEKRSMW